MPCHLHGRDWCPITLFCNKHGGGLVCRLLVSWAYMLSQTNRQPRHFLNEAPAIKHDDSFFMVLSRSTLAALSWHLLSCSTSAALLWHLLQHLGSIVVALPFVQIHRSDITCQQVLGIQIQRAPPPHLAATIGFQTWRPLFCQHAGRHGG